MTAKVWLDAGDGVPVEAIACGYGFGLVDSLLRSWRPVGDGRWERADEELRGVAVEVADPFEQRRAG